MFPLLPRKLTVLGPLLLLHFLLVTEEIVQILVYIFQINVPLFLRRIGIFYFRSEPVTFHFQKIRLEFLFHLLISSKVWFDPHMIPLFVWCQLKVNFSLVILFLLPSPSVSFFFFFMHIVSGCLTEGSQWYTHTYTLSQVWNSDTQCLSKRCQPWDVSSLSHCCVPKDFGIVGGLLKWTCFKIYQIHSRISLWKILSIKCITFKQESGTLLAYRNYWLFK